MKKRFFSALLCLCLLAGLVPNMGLTAQAAGAAIGQTVEFAGHEWYIIGTDDEADGGVTAPEGCYTLFAKDNDFGTSDYRGIREYATSNLAKAMKEIEDKLPSDDKDSIVSRESLSLLWPLSPSEFDAVDETMRKFDADYWLRDGGEFPLFWPTDVFLPGEGEEESAPAEQDPDYPWVGYWGTSDGDYRGYCYPYDSYALRPSLYVKREAIATAFLVGSDAIENASVGGNLVANTGTDTPLLTDSGMSANVLVNESGGRTQSDTSLAFNLVASGTTTGANQVLACVMTDSTGAVQYYGKLANCPANLANTTAVSVPMADVANGTYTLSIFAHNTADNTISSPSPTMTVTVSGGVGTVSNYNGGTYVDGGYLAFTQQPQDQDVQTNETATFAAKAVDSTGSDESVTYTWQVQRLDGNSSWETILDDSTGEPYHDTSITFTKVTGTWADNGFSLELESLEDSHIKISDGFRIRCRATSPNSFYTVDSNPATLTVDPAPAFTQQPQDQTAEAGSATSFSAEAASIGGVTYTWQAQPKTSNPVRNQWYDIYSYVSTGISLPYTGQTLYLPNVSGSWQDNEKVLYDGSGVVYVSTFDPAEARFRCVATDENDRAANSDPAELTVTGGTVPEPEEVIAIAGYGGSIDQTTYTATADSGFVIDQMWVDGAEITAASGQTSYTPATAPTSNVFVTFAYTVNFNTPAGGSLSVTRGGVTLTSGTIVRPGDVLTITAAPDSGYTLDSLTVNGTFVTAANGVYTYTVGAQPTTTRTVGGESVVAVGANIQASFASGGTTPTITGVTVTPATATVQQGNTRQFSASVTGTGDFSQAVTWTVEGAVSAGTTISTTGLLTVGADETATTLTVRATSNGDNTKSGTAAVTVETATAPQEFTISFDGNGGANPASQTTVDGRLTSLPASTRSGYDFLGWYTAASGGTRVTTGTVFTADAILYAHWDSRDSGDGSKPTQPTGPSTDNNDGWTDIQEEIGGAEDGDTITVDMNGETEVPGEIFEEVAGKDVTVEFDMGGGVSWTVNGEDVPTNTDFSDLNLGVDMDTSGISVDVINTITGEYGAVQVSLDHDGEFGFALTLTAPLGRENAGYWANLYHYDEDAKTLNYETSALIDGDGSAALRMTHASQYAIVIDDKSHDLPFTDVAQGAWYESAVRYVYTHGSMEGMSATTFAPNKSLTRAEAVQVLYNLEGQLTVSNSSTFPDLVHDWYKPAIAWAEQTGVVDGYEDGTFRPDQPVTRQEFAQMLYNYAKYKDYDLTAEGDLSAFPDGNKVQEWAVPAMSWANGNQLINGHDDGTLEPGGTATRAQAASILTRFDQNFTSK